MSITDWGLLPFIGNGIRSGHLKTRGSGAPGRGDAYCVSSSASIIWASMVLICAR